jgi:hypothetical protein
MVGDDSFIVNCCAGAGVTNVALAKIAAVARYPVIFLIGALPRLQRSPALAEDIPDFVVGYSSAPSPAGSAW